MFSIGDKVVYPIHGAGVIADIQEKEVLGEVQEYYILKMPTNHMNVMVPVSQIKKLGVREILSKEEMDQVFEIFSQEDQSKLPKNWNRRYRYNMDRIKSGDIEEIARVVLCLENLDQEKNLSTGERKMLNNAKQIIISEMILVYDKDQEELSDLIDHAIFSKQ
ncbi:CarD-like/TRCF domain [Urinicoccus massiliensis]|uniref:CarD-like/TRCF domain n=1 Tax=Urinicoccus massiliensis TaxID=1723382 RepID=A0A8H2QYG2_9FIRM|nr:CarD family transcriptional regulator [Urinicoccus massiliensis]KGF11601.1 CarD family transcriptional regulator [Tissierellia bacterium S5-A11]VFB16887.1 CarD-like/TRCF domain [Urinicoccus massiliensis]